MAKRAARKRAASSDDDASKSASPALDKIAGLLALIATKEMEKDSAALKLDACGFTAREIAGLLDVGTNFVNVARHRASKKK
jgi:hypothetical protein